MDSEEIRKQLQQLLGKTTSAKMRELMPEIDDRVKAGVSHLEIVNLLNSQGLKINLDTFRVYLYRYRKKRGLTRKLNTSTEGSGTLPTNNDVENERGLDDIMNPKKREDITQKYMNKKPILKKGA